MFHLLLRALDQVTVVLGTVTTFNALGNALLKKAVHRLAVWHRVARELIAQIVQLETEPRRESAGVRDGSRYIAKERIHLPCRAEIAQVVDSEQAARLIEFDMMPDSCKQILNLAVVFNRVANAVRCDQRKVQGMCDADSSLIPPLLFALPMALQFDIDVPAAEDTHHLFNCLACRRFATTRERRGQRALIPSREADQTGGVLAEIVEVRCALALRGLTHLELRDELTEILIALTRRAEQRQPRRLFGMLMGQPRRRRQPRPEAGDGNFSADVRADCTAFCAGMEAGRAVHAVVVEQCDRRHFERGCPLDQAFGLRCGLEQAEGARRVQFNVSVSHRAPPSATDSATGRERDNSKASLHSGCGPPDPIVRIPIATDSTTRRLSPKGHKPLPRRNVAPERQKPPGARLQF